MRRMVWGAVLALALIGCGKKKDNDNQVPIAAANAAETSVMHHRPVALDGSISSDPDGDALTYTWSVTSAPSGSTAGFDDAAAAQPTFTADMPGTFEISLVVNDGAADSSPATVGIDAYTRVAVIGAPVLVPVLEADGIVVDSYGGTPSATAPSLGDGYVVWADRRDGTQDVWAYDIANDTEFRVSDGAGAKFRVSGDYIVWQRGTDVVAYTISTGAEEIIGSEVDTVYGLDFDGDYIVWTHDGGGAIRNITAYDIAAGAEIPVTNNSPPVVNRNAKISDGIIVWEANDTGGGTGFDILGFDIASSQTFTISNAANNQLSPSIAGDYVAWVDERDSGTNFEDIYAYRLSTQVEVALEDTAARTTFPLVNRNGLVVYETGIYPNNGLIRTPFALPNLDSDMQNGSGNPINGFYDIEEIGGTSEVLFVEEPVSNSYDLVYHPQLVNDPVVRVAQAMQFQPQLALSNGMIVWEDENATDGYVELFMTTDLGTTIEPVVTTRVQLDDVTLVGDYHLIIMGESELRQGYGLDVFSAATVATTNILAIGGNSAAPESAHLATHLEATGEFALSAPITNTCATMPVDATTDGATHPIFAGLATTDNSLNLDNQIIDTGLRSFTTDTAEPESPADWTELAVASVGSCAAGATVIVELTAVGGTRIIIDGVSPLTYGIDDWAPDRETLFLNEVRYLSSAY